ncbi:MAG: hypothetical protein CMI12_02335 [Oceanospirillum sp.]|nr:hypothetical protein [Oceanospirillum sp.]
MNTYSKLSLRWQIALPIVMLSLLILLLGYTGYSGIRIMSEHSAVVAGKLNPATSAILNADRDLYQAATAMRDYVTIEQSGGDKQAAKQDFNDNVEQATKRMMTARQLAGEAGMTLASEQAFKQSLSQWQSQAQQVFSLADQGQIPQALALIQGGEGKAFGLLRDQYDLLGEQIDQYGGALAEKIAQSSNTEEKTMLLVLVVSLFISLIAAIYISSLVVKPLLQQESLLSSLADGDGDLTRRIPAEGKNEVAAVAHQVNRFVDFLQGMISEAQTHTNNMNQVIDRLTENASQTKSSAQHQQQAVQQVHTAVSELQNAIHEIANNAQHTSGESNQASKDIAVSGQAIEQSSSQINTLSSDMQNVVQQISELEQESNNIASVLDVIGGIAEQTNLLALNAAIEAARAGEAGRGFAVVADEVRTLASKTQQSTQDIQEMIDRLQNGVANAVQAMQQANGQVSSTVESAGQASEALNKIVGAINNINDMSASIAASTEEQSSVIQGMTTTIDDVSMHSTELSQLADQTHSEGGQLYQSITVLAGHLNKFKV